MVPFLPSPVPVDKIKTAEERKELSRFFQEQEGCCFNLTSQEACPILSQQVCLMTLGFEAAVSGCKQALIVLFSELHGGKLRNGVLIQTFDVGNNQEHRGDNEVYRESDPVYLGLILIRTSTGILKQVCHRSSGLGSSFATEDFSARFPEFCTIFRPLNTTSLNNLSDLYRVIGLNQSGKLDINQEIVAGDCSSVTLDSQYVIYSTFSHQFKFIELSEASSTDITQLSASKTFSIKPSKTLATVTRAVERGSTIVTIVPSCMKVILQMPR
ncbi:hypothetical protein O181_055108 [Austropuccinia psidii MF-1]|uniref:ELP1 N-terminal second beta-propeller domain-containing protein n=1 Tax=Austropuccinia psidii MF-1 TaxID=1389203 RepID=A0A9Q3HS32_9BASI|nr:hypothetical protein [Austropuccinia psidii MF-1]